MDRRDFLRTAATGVAALALAQDALSAEMYFPSKVDPKLFQDINRVKDPANKTGLEKTHAPVIKAPAEVKAEEPFVVEVSVGEALHVMGQAHWIEYIELNIGNEPAGRVDFQSRGYLKPRASFTVVLGKDLAAAGKVTLVAYQRCNLHGYWEGSADVKVTA
jgi:superoxide reductase